MQRRHFLAALSTAALAPAAREPKPRDPRLKGAVRLPSRQGWIPVRLEGSPTEIGYQHGFLLAAEVEDAFRVIRLSLTHDSGKDWPFYRRAAQAVLWPRVDAEYREELQGMVDGLAAHGSRLDLWDVVAMNAFLELAPYYTNWLDSQTPGKPVSAMSAPEHCSAFVATGSYTRDGRVVMGHSNWSDYMQGQRWNIIFDVRPASGAAFLMDGFPGLIHSADDFSVNANGIAITETTISQFRGFNPDGIPEFVRARKAMQYSSSIDDVARIMREGNNGGYANNWLIADRKTSEVASLELGLKHVTLRRTRDGYFVGANFPVSEALAKDETDFNLADRSSSPNARRIRGEQLVEQSKGQVDVAFGKRFLSDHHDSFTGKDEPNERTLCGHIDLSARGSRPWQPPFGIAGTVQAKVADAAMMERLSFTGAIGHPCGIGFRAAAHLRKHPEFDWQRDVLRDLPSRPWVELEAGR